MSAYTNEQLKEIDKILKFIKQMEGIVRTSPSREQVERVRKELKKFREKLKEMIPTYGENLAGNAALVKKSRARTASLLELD